MALSLHEKYSSPNSIVLSCAEQLTQSQIEASTPLVDRPTWGALEQSLASRDETVFNESKHAFEMKLRENATMEFSTRAEAESAAMLSIIGLFRARLDGKSISIEEMHAAATLIHDVRELTLRSPFSEAVSYAFELEILETLLENGHLAFLSSPREENSQTPALNSDVYLFSENSQRKVPISAKLGAKKSAHYSHGVRSVSRKDWQRKGVSLIDYLRHRVPELH
ncbi:MAG: hypothetical protein WBP12_00695 [Candidatus Saccharimonas sp.]